MKSQEKIIQAFRGLVLTQPYDSFTVQTIVQQAGVGRSTFYTHFRDKDELLLKSLSPILQVLAELVNYRITPARCVPIFEHIWENRQLGRVFFQTPLVNRIARALLGEIDEPYTPANLYRVHGILGVMGMWCEGRINLTPTQMGSFLATNPDD